MDRQSVRVLVYAAIFGLAYWAWRSGAGGIGPSSRLASDPLSGQPITPDAYNLLTTIRASGQAGGSI